jgi:hypothetical protein
MSPTQKNRFAQVILLSIWIGIIILEWTSPVDSQTCHIPLYSHPITEASWLPGTQVSVQLDAFFDSTERGAIMDGNLQWNNIVETCSGVVVLGFRPCVHQ